MTPWLVLGAVVLLLLVLAVAVARRRADRELVARDAAGNVLTQAAEISESIRIWAAHPDTATEGIWTDLVLHCQHVGAAAQQLAIDAVMADRRVRMSALADALAEVAEQLQRRETLADDGGTEASLLAAVERLDEAARALQVDL